MKLSFNERQRLVQAAIQEARGSTECYVVELYDDRAIYECYGETADAGKSFEVTYAIADDETVTIGDRTEVVRETTYRAKAVKFSGKDTIEGPIFLFGQVDVDGEIFTSDTDFCLEWFGKSGRPILYEHGLDRELKTATVGRQVDYELREEGIWAQAELNRNARYRKAIDQLVDEGALGYSGGAMQHLAKKNRKSGEITVFPWVEASLTPTPAAPGNLGIHYVKSAAFLEYVDDDQTQLSIAAVKAIAAGLTETESGPTPLDEQAGRVSAAIDEFRDHAREAAAMRLKTGRVLSAVNRERIGKALASKEAVLSAYADLEALLAETEAEPAKSSDYLSHLAATGQIDDRLLGLGLLPKGLHS